MIGLKFCNSGNCPPNLQCLAQILIKHQKSLIFRRIADACKITGNYRIRRFSEIQAAAVFQCDILQSSRGCAQTTAILYHKIPYIFHRRLFHNTLAQCQCCIPISMVFDCFCAVLAADNLNRSPAVLTGVNRFTDGYFPVQFHLRSSAIGRFAVIARSVPHIYSLKHSLLVGILHGKRSILPIHCAGISACIYRRQQLFLCSAESSDYIGSPFQISPHIIHRQTVARQKNFPMGYTAQSIRGFKGQFYIPENNIVSLQLDRRPAV